ncbi:MAG: aldehyde dehydrogenase family protein, partial [Lachnospiraceae bacterium]
VQGHGKYPNEVIDENQKIWGGESNAAACRIAPTLFCNASFEDPIMEEEIFGPILPIISYSEINQMVQLLKKRDKPLACYIFSQNRQLTKKLLYTLSFGGGCVNDVVMHLANDHLPFGGVGNSGMGSYHGKSSFTTFTREKSILTGKNFLDLPLRYPPYSSGKLWLLRRIIG